APVAPHMMEEIWQILGHDESISYVKWPSYDESKLIESVVEVMIQINGKLRGKIKVKVDTAKEELEKQALADQHVQKFLADKEIRKIIIVPNKIINIVAK
ncbi:MAG: class I tRNA ligase family protein, partial [Lactobacillus iners]|nr:class I tRNA ligase family protein [Lactobacillus iners]